METTHSLVHALAKDPPILIVALVALSTVAFGTAAFGTPSSSASVSTGLPRVTISPLNGTEDASPRSQISFLGAPQSELHDIVVTGSHSGRHYGRLAGYSTGEGVSYLPSVGFTPGEQVTVSAALTVGHSTERISSRFSVGDPFAIAPTRPGPRTGSPRHPTEASLIQSFHSLPELHPPAVSVTTRVPGLAPGDLFISPDSGPGQAGPMIVEPSGKLIWFQPMAANLEAMDLRVQQYFGTPVLTWWQGQVVDGHGQGEDVLETPAYKRIGTVHAGNGLYADLHEFELTPQGTAFITAYFPVHWDLAQYGGSKNGLLDDCVVQEIDIRTGLVMFEWHALGHVNIADSYEPAPRAASSLYDYFHINSIELVQNRDLLISARNTWGVYMVETATGNVQWSLGGKKSSFRLGPGVRFAWQHDAELLPDSVVSIFDDEDSPKEASQSRAVNVALNFKQHQATLVRQLTHPGTPILSPSQGNAQPLPGGDELVGWGQAGFVSEFAETGTLLFDMRLPALSNSYRAYTFPWSGEPAGQPAIAASPSKQGTTVYASWNGATAIAQWQVLAGASRTNLTPAATFPDSGFETTMPISPAQPYVAVQALSASGAVLGTSPSIKG
jgi:hypothetical protein